MQRVELTDKDRREVARVQALVNTQPASSTALRCAGCGRGMPCGYLAVVTKWYTIQWGSGFPVMRPAEAFCQGCAGRVVASKASRRSHAAPKGQQTPSPVVIQAKEIAKKLLTAASDVPHGSRHLCRAAGLEYSDLILPILRKLRAAGKVRFEEGRWARV